MSTNATLVGIRLRRFAIAGVIFEIWLRSNVAEEWDALEKAPKVRMLSGELHSERIITPEEETRYLTMANSLLSEIATVLVDTGLRLEA